MDALVDDSAIESFDNSSPHRLYHPLEVIKASSYWKFVCTRILEAISVDYSLI